MATQQKLKKLEIKQLKGLKDVEIDFSEKPLTAIMGPNGSGKSTILHALACVNNPVQHTVNHKFSNFFTPTTHSIWQGSSFAIHQDFVDSANRSNSKTTHFKKARDRWSPPYSTRLQRYVSYIGIKTCVPKIENETQQGRIRFNTIPLTDGISNKVKVLAGQVMNRNYSVYNEHHAWGSKRYIGVENQGVNYSSLSMGAGEQRIFYILSEVIKAPNYGLILIDEIDLLLHQDALHRLLEILNDQAVRKHLQIIFTTHAQSILPLDFIAFRHLYQTPDKTLCFNSTKPGALQRLTGEQIRPLEIFVEDDLAKTLIEKISSEKGMIKYVSVKCFGAIDNCFTSVGGAILNNIGNIDNMLFVLDGDKYKTNDEKKIRMNKILTGSSAEDDEKREKAIEKITQFVIPDNTSPEKYYHSLILQLSNDNLNTEEREVVEAAGRIVSPTNQHKFLDDIIDDLGCERNIGLYKIVNLLAQTVDWNTVKSNIENWFETKRDSVIETPQS